MKKWFGILVIGTALLFMLASINTENNKEATVDVTEKIKEPSYEYGILADSFDVKKGIVKSGQSMGEILYANHIDHPEINTIVNKSKEIFDVRSINVGKSYTVMCTTDSSEKAQYFVPNKYNSLPKNAIISAATSTSIPSHFFILLIYFFKLFYNTNYFPIIDSGYFNFL